MSLGKSAFNSSNLKLHAHLVKPMKFTQLKIQTRNEQNIKTGCDGLTFKELPHVACFSLDHPESCYPPSLGPSPWLSFGPFLKFSSTYTSPRKRETCGCRARPPWWASGNRMIRLLNDSNFKAKYYFMKGLHSQSDEYGISNPVLLSCQDHLNGVSLQYTPK